MFKRCIKTEIRKAFLNKAMLIALAIAVALSIFQAIHAVRVLEEYQTGFEMGWLTGNPMITAISLFARWLGADVTSFQGTLFFFLLPLIAVLPYGWSAADEIHSGYTKNILTRTGRKHYFISKYLAAFLSAATVVLIPLLLNLFVLSMFFPALHDENIYPYGGVAERSMWSRLYYKSPLAYTGLYIALDALFAGLIAAVSAMLAFFVKYKVPVLLIPFFILLFWDYAANYVFPGWEASPIKFLQTLPVNEPRLALIIFAEAIILFGVTAGIIWRKGRRHEAL